MELEHKGFEEHKTKEGLWIKRLETMFLYVDFRKEVPFFYAVQDGVFVDSDVVNNIPVIKEIKLLLDAQKSQSLKDFNIK